MDEIVKRAMQKWPNVPNVFGWLSLDRRGNWRVKGRTGGFERIGNRAVVDFIGRNYTRDEKGRWFFQNGPQRVFVLLDYTPFVFRLAADGASFETHTGTPAGQVRGAWLDENGELLLEAEAGLGVVQDRDLAQLRLVDETGRPIEDEGQMSGTLALDFGGRQIAVTQIRANDVAARFGFDPKPAAAPGEPDC
jgi:hypothetical protein